MLFLLGCLTCVPDCLELVLLENMAQILVLGVRLLSGETWLQNKNSTGRRWDFNPDPCRQHSHCCKHAKPLLHLDVIEFKNLYYLLFYWSVYRQICACLPTRTCCIQKQIEKSIQSCLYICTFSIYTANPQKRFNTSLNKGTITPNWSTLISYVDKRNNIMLSKGACSYR